jgi:hypothetical protein
METIKLHKYTLKYYLGVYLTTDDERYFKAVCNGKKGRAGWSCEINGKSMEINEYLNNK